MVKENYDISVVIPTCDRPTILKECLNSVFSQTILPFEVIVVDNGNEPIDPRDYPYDFRYVRALPKFGVSQARNFGAIFSRGDYIAFLDDDDQWELNYLETIIYEIKNNQQDILLATLKDMSTKKVIQSKSNSIKNLTQFKTELLKRNPGAVGSNTVITRELFMQFPGYDPYLTTGQDKAMILEIIFHRPNIKIFRSNANVLFRQDNTIERQTEIKKHIQGKTRFYKKYKKEMTIKIKLIVKLQLFRMRLKSILGAHH